MLKEEYEASQSAVNLTAKKSYWDRISGWETTDQTAGGSGARVGRLGKAGRAGRAGRAGGVGKAEAFAAWV